MMRMTITSREVGASLGRKEATIVGLSKSSTKTRTCKSSSRTQARAMRAAGATSSTPFGQEYAFHESPPRSSDLTLARIWRFGDVTLSSVR